ARDQADDWAGAPRRIPDRRVSPRARHRRRRRPPERSEAHRGTAPPPHEWQAGLGRVDDLLTSYGAAIDALFARTTRGIKPGLERTEAILARLGSPHRRLTAIHVAGTNGKGSVVATA